MKRFLKHSIFLNICFKFLTTAWSCPHYHGYTANSNHPNGATTTFMPIPIGLPRQISPLQWYYGSNHITTAILIPCQSLSLTAKTSWTYTPWLSTRTVYCIACWYNGQWWLGNITEMLSDEDNIKVTFTHQCGPGPTFCWPHWENIWDRKRPVCRRHLHHYWYELHH